MARSGHQSTWDGERLRKETRTLRRDAAAKESSGARALVGTAVLLPDAVTDPGAGWILANGETYPRTRYPKLAKMFATTGDNATFVVTSITPPAGYTYWIWSGETE